VFTWNITECESDYGMLSRNKYVMSLPLCTLLSVKNEASEVQWGIVPAPGGWPLVFSAFAKDISGYFDPGLVSMSLLLHCCCCRFVAVIAVVNVPSLSCHCCCCLHCLVITVVASPSTWSPSSSQSLLWSPRIGPNAEVVEMRGLRHDERVVFERRMPDMLSLYD